MKMRHGIGLALGPGQNRIVRARNYINTYADPASELRRLALQDVIEKVAGGYYMIPPDTARHGAWRPPGEAIGAGIALADYAYDEVALVGISAARVLGVVPRALGVATVAVPKQRPKIKTRYGEIIFRKLNVANLALRRVDTEVVTVLVTTPTQTVLDLAFEPGAGNIMPATAAEAIRNLVKQVDWKTLQQLARVQRKMTGLYRAAWIAADIITVPPLPPPHERVNTAELQGSREFVKVFGIRTDD